MRGHVVSRVAITTRAATIATKVTTTDDGRGFDD